MKRIALFTLRLSIWSSFGCNRSHSGPDDLELWYQQPAGKWIEALPVGNGRLGGMVFFNR